MYKLTFLTLILAGLILQSCSQGYKKTDSGIQYKYLKKGEIAPLDSQFMLLHVMYYNEKDTMLNTAKKGRPLPFMYTDSLPKGGIEEIIQLLKKGDSVEVKIIADSVYKNSFRSPLPPEIDSGSYITFNIGVIDIMSKEDYIKSEEERRNKALAEAKERAEKQLTKDKEIIKEYLKENNISATETESGLFYEIVKPSKGPKPEMGDNVKVNYTGMLLDGTVFDTSIEDVAKEGGVYNKQRKYEPIEFMIGLRQVIKGWDEGIALLNEGTKAKLFIPSGLAYGEYGSGKKIKENEVLVFEVELVEVTKREEEK